MTAPVAGPVPSPQLIDVMKSFGVALGFASTKIATGTLVRSWSSVATTGTSVYGTEGGSEQMLDIYLEQDGTCSVEPLEAPATARRVADEADLRVLEALTAPDSSGG